MVSRTLGDAALRSLAATVLLMAVIVRVYCAYCTVPIVTWDDRQYRQFARSEGEHWPLRKLPMLLLSPQTDSLHGIRSRGYHSWITAGYAFTRAPAIEGLWGELDPEWVWQTVNMLALAVQLCLLFLFARWATGRSAFALAVTALYATTPIVFGINRWVLTENHAVTALLCIVVGSSWYVATSSDGPSLRSRAGLPASTTSRRCAQLVGISLAIGVLSSMREYGVPVLLGSLLLVGGALAWQRRGVECLIFFLPLVPYLAALPAWLPRSLRHLSVNNQEVRFDHPLAEWTLHAFRHAVGPALSLLLLLLFALAGRELWQHARRGFRVLLAGGSTDFDLKPIDLAIAAHGSLCLAYLLGIVQTEHRTMRPTLVLIALSLPLALLVARRTRLTSQQGWPLLQTATIGLLILSACVWGHQLFFAFEGGRSYLHHATELEYYNHPAHLKTLSVVGAMHTAP